ncbi:MAG TPA: helicase C-terminal domain-containing protein, partial [Candidatus Dormibacteraeota bacterium]|nr:helicase C-terminal domain-containing protein [Candidatus Dormibacteraeota bacterium]
MIDTTAALTPAALGIAGFDAFRPAQIVALERIVESDARVLLVQAPTGSGKSLLARAAGAVLGMPATYCSTTKQLQAQFCRDFQDAVELRGRANYPTAKGPFPAVTCDDCDWRDGRGCSWCESRESCPYRVQKQKAIEAPFAVLNTAYFLAEANSKGDFSDPERLLVIDEADALEAQLLETVCVRLSEHHLQRLGMSIPPLTDRPEEENWTTWAAQAATAVRMQARQLEHEADAMRAAGGEPYTRARRRARGWRALATNVGRLARDLAEDARSWVRVENGEGLSFKPVFVRRYAHRLLWGHAARFVLMSATIIDPEQFARDLGLQPDEWEWLELPSSFPKENRPVFYRPAGSMAFRQRDETLPRMIAALDAILDDYPERVLVHTHTYGIARQVIASSRHRGRMLTYASADERERALGAFTAVEGGGKVLIAPSMARGVDLPDDLCRCVVVMVVPKPYQGDARVRLRLRTPDGQRWSQVHQ